MCGYSPHLWGDFSTRLYLASRPAKFNIHNLVKAWGVPSTLSGISPDFYVCADMLQLSLADKTHQPRSQELGYGPINSYLDYCSRAIFE